MVRLDSKIHERIRPYPLEKSIVAFLLVAFRNRNCNVSFIAKKTGCTSSHNYAVAGVLEKWGVIETLKVGRTKQIRLTIKGIKVCNALELVFEALIGR